jgi:hypothetical protein
VRRILLGICGTTINVGGTVALKVGFEVIMGWKIGWIQEKFHILELWMNKIQDYNLKFCINF